MALLKNLITTSLMKILRYFLEKSTINQLLYNQRPVIDFNINFLFLNKIKASDSIKIKVEKIIAILISFFYFRVICNLVAYLEEYYNNKRIFIERRAYKIILEI